MPGGFCFPSVPATLIKNQLRQSPYSTCFSQQSLFIFHKAAAVAPPLPSYSSSSSRYFHLLNFSISWREISFFKHKVQRVTGQGHISSSSSLLNHQTRLSSNIQTTGEAAARVTAHKVPWHKHSSTANHTFMSNTGHSAGREIWNRIWNC